MGWGKGTSGNPGGRSKRSAILARLARSHTRDGLDLVEFAVRVLKGEESEATLRDRLDAMRWLADRGWGKSPEPAGDADDAADVSAASDADLEAGLEPGELN